VVRGTTGPAAASPNVVPVLTTESTRSRRPSPTSIAAAAANGATQRAGLVPANSTPATSGTGPRAAAIRSIPAPAHNAPATTGTLGPTRPLRNPVAAIAGRYVA